MFSRTPGVPCALAVLLLQSPLSSHAQSSSDAGLIQPAAASAGPDAVDYVVTASRRQEPAGRNVRPLQVITAEELRASGASSLADVLRTLGGVEVTSSGGLGQNASVFMRGANSAHTVILVDGVRLNSPSSGSATLEAFPLAMVERIEVLPGASSSLYGADAIGGVIQVFTRSVERSPGLTLAATAGSEGLRQLSGTYAARVDDTEFALSATSLRTDGYDITTADNYYHQSDRDGYRDHLLNLRLGQHLGEEHLVGVQWLNSQATSAFDEHGSTDSETRTRLQNLVAFWEGRLSDDWRSELRLARGTESAHTQGDYPGYLDTLQTQVGWLNHLALGGAGNFTAGLEWLRQALASDSTYDKSQRSVRAGLLGWHAAYGPVALQADLRRDDNTQFGAHNTGQLSAAWQWLPELRLRASAGTAFKAPSFNDLYYSGSGNPDLKAERSRSYELGADAAVAGADLSATLFHNRIRDLIAWQPAPTPSDPYRWAPSNVDSARNRGLSLSAAAALSSSTRIKLNATWQRPENSETGAQLQRRARQFGGMHLSQRLGDWSLGTDLTYVGSRFDSADEAAGTRMGAYTLVALFASWRITPDWALEARVDNLADRAYESAQGFVPPGRAGQLTLRWTPALGGL